jgi:hypothetical protein
VSAFLEDDVRLGHMQRGSFVFTVVARLDSPAGAITVRGTASHQTLHQQLGFDPSLGPPEADALAVSGGVVYIGGRFVSAGGAGDVALGGNFLQLQGHIGLAVLTADTGARYNNEARVPASPPLQVPLPPCWPLPESPSAVLAAVFGGRVR